MCPVCIHDNEKPLPHTLLLLPGLCLGRCECPIGYTGPTCQTPVWASCKLHHNASEMFCDIWLPKSCECLRQCFKSFCPKGPSHLDKCDLFYDIANAKCFERPADHSAEMNTTEWDGGSDIPADHEENVQYFHGVPLQEKVNYVPRSISRCVVHAAASLLSPWQSWSLDWA